MECGQREVVHGRVDGRPSAVIAIAVVTGYLIQHFAPDAVSIGDLWRR